MLKAHLVHVMFLPVGFQVVGGKSFTAKTCDFLIKHSPFVHFFVFDLHVTRFVRFTNYCIAFVTFHVGVEFGHQFEVYSKFMNTESPIGK